MNSFIGKKIGIIAQMLTSRIFKVMRFASQQKRVSAYCLGFVVASFVLMPNVYAANPSNLLSEQEYLKKLQDAISTINRSKQVAENFIKQAGDLDKYINGLKDPISQDNLNRIKSKLESLNSKKVEFSRNIRSIESVLINSEEMKVAAARFSKNKKIHDLYQEQIKNLTHLQEQGKILKEYHDKKQTHYQAFADAYKANHRPPSTPETTASGSRITRDVQDANRRNNMAAKAAAVTAPIGGPTGPNSTLTSIDADSQASSTSSNNVSSTRTNGQPNTQQQDASTDGSSTLRQQGAGTREDLSKAAAAATAPTGGSMVPTPNTTAATPPAGSSNGDNQDMQTHQKALRATQIPHDELLEANAKIGTPDSHNINFSDPKFKLVQDPNPSVSNQEPSKLNHITTPSPENNPSKELPNKKSPIVESKPNDGLGSMLGINVSCDNASNAGYGATCKGAKGLAMGSLGLAGAGMMTAMTGLVPGSNSGSSSSVVTNPNSTQSVLETAKETADNAWKIQTGLAAVTGGLVAANIVAGTAAAWNSSQAASKVNASKVQDEDMTPNVPEGAMKKYKINAPEAEKAFTYLNNKNEVEGNKAELEEIKTQMNELGRAASKENSEAAMALVMPTAALTYLGMQQAASAVNAKKEADALAKRLSSLKTGGVTLSGPSGKIPGLDEPKPPINTGNGGGLIQHDPTDKKDDNNDTGNLPPPLDPGSGGSNGGGGSDNAGNSGNNQNTGALANNPPGSGSSGGVASTSDKSAVAAEPEAQSKYSPNASVPGYQSAQSNAQANSAYKGGSSGASVAAGPDLSALLEKLLPKKEDMKVNPEGILSFGKNDTMSEVSLLDKSVNIFNRVHETYQKWGP